jgi:hexosaminidase
LAAAGAYHWSAQYSSADILGLQEYALNQGVRVMLEFDTPGHSDSWGQYYNISTNCPKYTHNINNINLNPSLNMTWDVLSGIIDEVAKKYDPAGYLGHIHMGGDEVVEDCWNDDPQVAAWMAAKGLDSKGVYQLFVDRVHEFCNESGIKPIFWDDVFNAGLSIPKSSRIEVWHTSTSDTLTQILEAGYDVIYSGSYYLDVQIPDPNNTWYAWVETWKNFYTADPTLDVDAKYASQIIGGEACMWSETTPSESIQERIWPRAAAVAERYWSAVDVNDVKEAQPRLEWLGCHLRRRGVPSAALEAGYCLM